MANSVDPDQTAPIGAVCSGSTLFASILNSPVVLGKYLQQTASADDIFRCIFFLGAFRVKIDKSLACVYISLLCRRDRTSSTEGPELQCLLKVKEDLS